MLTELEARALARPFFADEIEWRVGRSGQGDRGTWIIVHPFVTARAIMDRFDEVLGVGGWSNSISPIDMGTIEVMERGKPKIAPLKGFSCTITAGGCSHSDCASCSDVEPLKGGASDALKRTAVHFGIGRYLYFVDSGYANIHQGGKYRHQNLRWDPPALPDWALPRPGEKRMNPYAPVLAPAPIEDLSTESDSLEEAFGLVDEKFAAHVRTLLADTKGVAGLRKAFAAGQAKIVSLGQAAWDDIDPKEDRFYIAERVLRIKARIIELEGASK